MGSRSSRSISTPSPPSSPSPPPLIATAPVLHNLSYYYYGGRTGFRPMEIKSVESLIKSHNTNSSYLPRDCLVFECESDQMLTSEQRESTKARLQEQLLQYQKITTLPILILAYDAKIDTKVTTDANNDTSTDANNDTSTSTTITSNLIINPLTTPADIEATTDPSTPATTTDDVTPTPDFSDESQFVFDIPHLTACLGLSSLSRVSHIEMCVGHVSDYDYSIQKTYRHNIGKSKGQRWVSQYVSKRQEEKRRAKEKADKEKEKEQESQQELLKTDTDTSPPNLELTEKVSASKLSESKYKLSADSKKVGKWKNRFSKLMQVIA